MGLDIFFLGRDRVTDAVVSVPETREVGYFRKVNPLIAWFESKRLVRTVLIFTESSDQLSRATDRVPGLPASPGYVQ